MKPELVEAIKRKGNFVFELSWDSDLLAEITDEEYGQIIRKLCEYVQKGEVERFNDRALNAMFTAMTKSIERATESYIHRCETNAQNAAKGGRAKAENRRSNSESFDPFMESKPFPP